MTRPHERLGLHQPIGRRLPRGVAAWNILIAVVTLACGVIYVVQVNAATSKGYALRDVQQRIDLLKNDTTTLQDKIATLASMQATSDRATQLGFVPVDRLEFVDPAHGSYALAH